MESSSSSISGSKRAKAIAGNISGGSQVVINCCVDGCNADLRQCKEYHRRHKVCEIHSKTPKVTISGREQRFCQQCSRFHSLVEFDEGKRSCRKRLDGHNRRRRKPQHQHQHQTTSSMSLSTQQIGGGTQLVSFSTSSPQILQASSSSSCNWGLKTEINNDMSLLYMNYNNNNNMEAHQNNKCTSSAAAHSSSSSYKQGGLLIQHNQQYDHHFIQQHINNQPINSGALSLLSPPTAAVATRDFGLNYNRPDFVIVPRNYDDQYPFPNHHTPFHHHHRPAQDDGSSSSTTTTTTTSNTNVNASHQTLKFMWDQ